MSFENICCVVTASDNSCNKKPQNPLSCSGVVLNSQSGLMLCSGLIFSHFLLDKECINKTPSVLTADSFSNNMQVAIYHTDLMGKQCMTNERVTCHQPAELLMMVNCVEFQRAFQKLFPDAESWNFYNGEEDAENLLDTSFLSWFAVLKISTTIQGDSALWIKSTTLNKGHSVLACGAPFGSLCPDLFMSTLSKGIVSNLAGEDNALILTDARCLPGTEGGGLFFSKGDVPYLVGLIASPLCWKSNEWIGLTVVCSLHLILKNVYHAITSHQSLRKIPTDLFTCVPQVLADGHQNPANRKYPTVVVVESGQLWGSGIMINPHLMITCRHVANGRTFLKVTNNNNQRCHTVNGRVLYSSKAASPYDIAVVQLEEPFSDVLVPRLSRGFKPGKDVLVLGYGALGKNCGPSLTSGILSRVVNMKNQPVMLQTTCAVQCGASGGAVICAKTGKLLGIVSSNTRDFTAKVTYPHLNFSIPVSVLEPLLRHFAQTGDSTVFQSLDNADNEVRRVWRLQMSQSKL